MKNVTPKFINVITANLAFYSESSQTKKIIIIKKKRLCQVMLKKKWKSKVRQVPIMHWIGFVEKKYCSMEMSLILVIILKAFSITVANAINAIF